VIISAKYIRQRLTLGRNHVLFYDTVQLFIEN